MIAKLRTHSPAGERQFSHNPASAIKLRREIWRRPMWRDREDELDLADIGRQMDTATHGAKIASFADRPKWLDTTRQLCDRLGTNKEHGNA